MPAGCCRQATLSMPVAAPTPGRPRSAGTLPQALAADPVQWRAYPGETPVFDGQGVSRNFMNIVGTDYLTIAGITVENYKGCCAAFWIGYSGSGTDYADHDTFSNDTIKNIGDVTDQWHGTNTHGIYLSYGVTNVTIAGNTIDGVTGAGIQAYHTPAANGVSIYANVIDGQDIATWGIVLRGVANVDIRNNIVIDSRPYNSDGGADIDYGGSTNVTIENNTVSLPIKGSGAVCGINTFINDVNGGSTIPNCG